MVKNQTFGLVMDEDTFDETFDAIIGLAYPAMAESAGIPLMDSMIKQEVLESNLFTFFMGTNEDEASEILFGAIDKSRYTGEIQYHEVARKNFWSLPLTDIKYNGKSLGICGGSKNKGKFLGKEKSQASGVHPRDKVCYVTPDSGTSFSTMPAWAEPAIREALPRKTENCKSDGDFGTLTYVIDDVEYDVPSAHFMEIYKDPAGERPDICKPNIEVLDI